jgi:transposase
MVAHQLSDWRRFARQGLLRLPAGLFPTLLSPMNLPVDIASEPTFVSLAIDPELEEGLADTHCGPGVAEVATGIVPMGIMTVEIGPEVVVRIPGGVAVERAAALVRALRGLS